MAPWCNFLLRVAAVRCPSKHRMAWVMSKFLWSSALQLSARVLLLWLLGSLLLVGGCATRPINPPVSQITPGKGYQYGTRSQIARDPQNLVILAFSGGGTRAAAFSYGVLEMLRRTEAIGSRGNRFRLIDTVDMITGVSGGSFTALAHGLYGDRLFDEYEKRFLKHNVQGELIAQYLNPTNWGSLSSTGYGRSELATASSGNANEVGRSFRYSR